MKIEKEKAQRIYKESPEWFKEELVEAFGEECFRENTFEDIKTFNDACKQLDMIPGSVTNSELTLDEEAYMKLKVIVKAINNGWVPDWNNSDQPKYWPYFNLSSGFGFSRALYGYVITAAGVGSRLCFETREKCEYAAKQFLSIYEDLLTIKK